MVDETMLKNLPADPGVYIMKDKNGNVIYVGKAKILKNRVRQYFQNTEKHTPKVAAMVSKVDTFEYILTDSELEALVLECNLIKKYRPYYNILLKDDKNYPYIKVTREDYPRLKLVRRMEKDGAKYFGPYTSAATVREAIDFVCKMLGIPSCDIKLPKDLGRRRACINAQIGKCCAPCENIIPKEEYAKRISDACDFLEGNTGKLVLSLEEQMLAASEKMEFERAATIRDKINAIRQMENKQKIVSEKYADEDIIGFFAAENKTFAEVFFVRRGRLLGHHGTVISNTKGMTEEEVAENFIKQFYEDADYIPKNIYTQYNCDNEELISAFLTEISGRSTKVITPKRGEKKAIVEMAHKNAKQSALNYMLKNGNGQKSIKRLILDLKEQLGLENPPYRIESYDISNTAGEENVGSMVVFVNGEPAKSKYRRFKIETAQGGDDYHSMSEMILRRLSHARDEETLIERGELLRENAKFLPLPDCIFLDGGKGHLTVISELLELTDSDIPLFAMVKDDRHRTNVLLKNDGSRVDLKRNSAEFRLVASIQEEVHRFAIEYHRKLRNKKVKHSSLCDINGVGEKTAKKLLREFKSIANIKQATVQELKKSGVSETVAKNIYNYFH
ncbi:MAG: excinuclease ABC subunit UvrC [Clostridia bacterium]|nr:excinuclease ABC subunit UvrC [Clostridia bacterium]